MAFANGITFTENFFFCCGVSFPLDNWSSQHFRCNSISWAWLVGKKVCKWGGNHCVLLRDYWRTVEGLLKSYHGAIEELLRSYWGTVEEPDKNLRGTIWELLGNYWGTIKKLLRDYWGIYPIARPLGYITTLLGTCCKNAAIKSSKFHL